MQKVTNDRHTNHQARRIPCVGQNSKCCVSVALLLLKLFEFDKILDQSVRNSGVEGYDRHEIVTLNSSVRRASDGSEGKAHCR